MLKSTAGDIGIIPAALCVAAVVFCVMLATVDHSKEKEYAKRLQVRGVVAEIKQYHNFIMRIRTDTGVIVNTSVSPIMANDAKLGDSIYKKSGDPFCVIVRNGESVARHWYSGVLDEHDFPDSTCSNESEW